LLPAGQWLSSGPRPEGEPSAEPTRSTRCRQHRLRDRKIFCFRGENWRRLLLLNAGPVSTDDPKSTTKKDGAAMKNPLIFVSTCPSCGQPRLQYGHTRRALTKLIESREIIDAYCLECDVVWPVAPEDRTLIACALAHRQSSTGPDCVIGLVDTMQRRPEAAHR